MNSDSTVCVYEQETGFVNSCQTVCNFSRHMFDAHGLFAIGMHQVGQ